MSELSKDQFENVLLDVRKAYRLLFLYQQRVLSLAQHIGDSLDFQTFGGGFAWCNFIAPPYRSKVKFDTLSWDLLGMYFYEFYFSEKKINNNLFRFSVLVEADTGYFDAQNPSEDVNSYSPVRQSMTKLIFLIGKNVWWDPDYKALFDDENLDLYKANSGSLIRTNEKGILIAKSFNLSDFVNNDQTNKCLNDWVKLLNDNNITEITVT
ncbi:hypothetical protein LX99_03327 [Mucilaginibacter oryzae]|uniref:Uncharacterized protein n=1 Tax=Mucilaginibacter oryzae TaxID=468058 RepID=A0A316H8Y4_9SPHI|nr:hypothetical protein [Mucilaginibacter oryzae]PWK76461.1 hypothetical protein LX99_03327 [Mucilaginibacter oryzae]